MPDANNDTSGAATPGLPDQNPLPTRFEVELEFVQSLANIQYVTYLLTQQQIWKSPNFKNYLKYLEYWCNPPYSQCIVYPNCLFILKLLNGFMESAIVNEDGLLEGLDELPKIIQLQGPQWMNEMVERWAN
ncbi:suppressor of hpr1 [Saccharomyces pastorianus]|nr:SOH1-like protein [Saccharomyces eubayanus]KOG99395.1 SOH1-like protein [Saccharomyces eubayanus]QID84966.1 suppressor of hpr1 [Saccharomyces pastorianus]